MPGARRTGRTIHERISTMLSLIVSTIVFFIASWFIKRQLQQMDIPEGMTRGILILTLATVASLASAAAVNWVQTEIEGPEAAQQSSGALTQLLKDASQAPH